MIVGGSVLVVLFSTKGPQQYTLAELISQFQQTPFIIYAGVTGAILVACILFYACFPKRPVTAPVCAFIAALLGSFSLLLGKCSVQLLKSTLSLDNQFTHLATYFIIAAFISCAVSNIHFINMGLQVRGVTCEPRRARCCS